MTPDLTLDNNATKIRIRLITDIDYVTIMLYTFDRTQVIRTCHPHLQKLKPSHLPSALTKTQAIPPSIPTNKNSSYPTFIRTYNSQAIRTSSALKINISCYKFLTILKLYLRLIINNT